MNFFQSLKAEKRLILFVAVLFFAFTLIGFIFADPILAYCKKHKIDLFAQFADMIRQFQKDKTYHNAFSMIFFNNFQASLVMIVSGITFGVLPILLISFNGFLLGIVLAMASHTSGQNPFLLFVTHILPHGIFELPAIFLASSLGLRLGWLIIRSLFRLEGSKEAWKQYALRLQSFLAVITILLIVAALVEAYLIVG
jgi:stage II sporulation protein M